MPAAHLRPDLEPAERRQLGLLSQLLHSGTVLLTRQPVVLRKHTSFTTPSCREVARGNNPMQLKAGQGFLSSAFALMIVDDHCTKHPLSVPHVGVCLVDLEMSAQERCRITIRSVWLQGREKKILRSTHLPLSFLARPILLLHLLSSNKEALLIMIGMATHVAMARAAACGTLLLPPVLSSLKHLHERTRPTCATIYVQRGYIFESVIQ